MPCQNRHILGWYRLIRELKDSGVGVICVFDGAERGRAKQREVRCCAEKVVHFYIAGPGRKTQEGPED
jgi:hypothetical protein